MKEIEFEDLVRMTEDNFRRHDETIHFSDNLAVGQMMKKIEDEQKHMTPRYINATAFEELLMRVFHNLKQKGEDQKRMEGIVRAVRLLKSAPNANVDTIRRGRWVKTDEDFLIPMITCSCCGEDLFPGELTDEEFTALMQYCPKCGAKMNGMQTKGEGER